MSAAELAQRIESFGAALWLCVDDGKVHVRGRSLVPDEIMEEARDHAVDLETLLREVDAIPTSTDAVISAQRLLRSTKWAFESSPCGFFVGPAAASGCQRCGVLFEAHFD